MHHCLRIPELAQYIFAHCDNSYALAATAATCHALSDLALDALWGMYGSLDALITLIPVDLVRGRNDGQRSRSYKPPLEFERPLRVSDWAYLIKYTSRLHKISTNCRVPASALQELCDICPTDVMFPNLRSLHYRVAKNERWQFTELFGPKLVELSIEAVWALESPPLSFLLRLPARCPELRNLSLEEFSNFTHFAGVLPGVICQYKMLQRLIIPSQQLSPQAIRHIIDLPDLSELAWECNSVQACEPDPGCSVGHRFPKLRRWDHTSSTLASFATIIPQLEPEKELDNLTLWIPHLNSADFHQAIILITEHLSHSKLTKFLFNHYPEEDVERGQVDLAPFASLKSLFCFNNLTELCICSGFMPRTRVTIDLDDSSLKEIAAAWPQLRMLRIRGLPTRVTMAGFWAILSGCRSLGDLQIQFCFSTEGLGVNDTNWLLPVENHPLRDLYVVDSPLHDPDGIAAKVLCRALPSLKICRPERGTQFVVAWREVIEEVEKIHKPL